MVNDYTWPQATDKSMDCPLANAIQSLSGKWKPMILHMLADQPHYFAEIEKNIPAASKKVITTHLRELEADCLIQRSIFEGPQVRVQYSLSSKGKKLSPILAQLYVWARENEHHVQ